MSVLEVLDDAVVDQLVPERAHGGIDYVDLDVIGVLVSNSLTEQILEVAQAAR
jgi:hypothetical protein